MYLLSITYLVCFFIGHRHVDCVNKWWQNEVNRRIEMSIRNIFSLIALLVMMLVALNGDAANSVLLNFSDWGLPADPMNSSPARNTQTIDNKYVTGDDGLPILLLRLVVKGGEIDSVAAERLGGIVIERPESFRKWGKVATFAGDDLRAVDFYQDELKRLGDESEQSAAAWVIDRGRWNGQEIVTVAVAPVDEIDEFRVRHFEHGELRVFGSADLEYRVIDAPRFEEFARTDGTLPYSKGFGAVSASELGAQYLAVTGSEFAEELQPLLRWKQAKGLTTALYTIDEITAEYGGVDDAEKLRNFLIAAHAAGTQYVLLAGDETVLPIRYAYHANTAMTPDVSLQNICDLYFADVDGNWDADVDGVYGEPAQDQPDLYGELLVGRLPFHRAEDFTAYAEKLIAYEQNPGGGDFEYLSKSLFIAADQMRDYQGVGQQQLLAQAFPSTVESDTSVLVEAPTGEAENPQFPQVPSAIAAMGAGWGFTTLLIHGVSDGWVLRSNEYNQWPKSFLFTAAGVDETHGFLPNIAANGKPGVIYSIGCDNAGFDMDAPPFAATNPCVAEMFLAKPNGGAVAFVGYSRWGWVATSWKLESAFINYLYSQSNSPAEALAYSKAMYPSYRDLCYGLNYLGDPELRYWTEAPRTSELFVSDVDSIGWNQVLVSFKDGDNAIAGALVTLTKNGEVIEQTMTDGVGLAAVTFEFNGTDEFVLTTYKAGVVTRTKTLSPEIVLDADDEEGTSLPQEFRLYQNFPNPFNPTTTIALDLPRAARVTMTIVNVLGQIVRTAVAAEWSAGRHEIEWDGRDDGGAAVSSGVYFAVLRSEDYRDAIKMSLLK